MKNHRDVCAANEAGYAEFEGLTGKIKTGCTNTPQLMSRYCRTHIPTTFTPLSNVEESEVRTSLPRSEQLALIVSKKCTRQGTLYEVRGCFLLHAI